MNSEEQDYIIFNPESQGNPEKPTDRFNEDDDFENEGNFNFTNLQNKKEVTLGEYDPKRKHLTVENGLNLKGKCNNKNCAAFKDQKSWIRVKYGTFDLSKLRFGHTCQNCGQKITGSSVKTFGYMNAKVLVEGIKIQGEDEIPYKQQLEENKGKIIYFTDYDEDIIKWGYLTLTVSRL